MEWPEAGNTYHRKTGEKKRRFKSPHRTKRGPRKDEGGLWARRGGQSYGKKGGMPKTKKIAGNRKRLCTKGCSKKKWEIKEREN